MNFDDIIHQYFNWADHIDDTPTLDSLGRAAQCSLAAAYLVSNPSEINSLMQWIQPHEAETVAGLIDGSGDPDSTLEFIRSIRYAAIEAFSSDINERIETLFERHCRDFGVYSENSDHGPGELIGFEEAA